MYNGEEMMGWNGVEFDDGDWERKRGGEMVIGERVTTYIRKSFQLKGIDDYRVLNVRMKYEGGVVAYLNGVKVGRFNLVEDFDDDTESTNVHDASVFSKFHIILGLVGVREGKNVMAFEVHRPVGTSSSEELVFDASGVFGMEVCSTVIDSYSRKDSNGLVSGSLDEMMDLDPYTTGTLSGKGGTYVEWVVENLEGSKWNSFNVVGGEDVARWVFELYGYENVSGEGEGRRLMRSNSTLLSRTKPQITIPLGLVGYRKIRYEIIESASDNTIGSILWAYCSGSGMRCVGDERFPSVGEGEMSKGDCGYGYTGYAYRMCENGVLGEIHMDKCAYETPHDIHYLKSVYEFVVGIESRTEKYENIVTNWRMSGGMELPMGLSLDELSGEISGIPLVESDKRMYRIMGENRDGVGSVEIEIMARRGVCKGEG